MSQRQLSCLRENFLVLVTQTKTCLCEHVDINRDKFSVSVHRQVLSLYIFSSQGKALAQDLAHRITASTNVHHLDFSSRLLTQSPVHPLYEACFVCNAGVIWEINMPPTFILAGPTKMEKEDHQILTPRLEDKLVD